MADTVQLATLRRALAIAGDLSELSARIGAGMESLRGMLRGDVAIEPPVFLRAVDYVNEAQEQPHRVHACDFHEGPGTRQ